MPRLTEEQLDKIRSRRRKPDTDGSPLGDVGSAALRYLRRGEKLIGRGVELGLAFNPITGLAQLPYKYLAEKIRPGPETLPFEPFWDQARQGDWDAAIEAYQDELSAGPGYWGASELAGSVIPTGGPFLAGGKLISAAPKLAGTLARPVVPATRAGVGVKRGIETGIRGTGKAMRLPWQAEEAVGRGIAKGVGKVAGPAVRPIVSRFRARRPAEEAVEEAVVPEAGFVPDEVDQILDQAPPPIADEGAPLADELLGQPRTTAAPVTGVARLDSVVTGFREGASTKPLPKSSEIKDNYLKPLSEFTDRLFHETDIDSARSFIRGGDVNRRDLFFSNNADIARGQTGKGILFEFSSEGVEGQINRIPGWDFSFDQGNAEFITRHVSPAQMSRRIISVTVEEGAAPGRRRDVSTLLGTWGKTRNPDGSVTYIRPTDVPVTPTPTTAAPVPTAIGTQLPLTPTAPIAAPAARALSALQETAVDMVKAEDMLKQAKKSRGKDRAERIRYAEEEIKEFKAIQEHTLKSESPDEWARYQELKDEEFRVKVELEVMGEAPLEKAPPFGTMERGDWEDARRAAGILPGATARQRARLNANLDRVQADMDDIITGRTQPEPDIPEASLYTAVPDEQAGKIKAENDPSKGQTPTPGEGGDLVPPPRKREPGKPRPTPEERAKLIYDKIKATVAAMGETVSEALLRRHEGAINAAEIEATLLTKFGRTGKGGEQTLHRLGLTETRREREVVKEAAKPIMRLIYSALHAPTGSRAQLRATLKAVDMPDGSVKDLRPVYDELRGFADWEQAARIKSDTSMELIEEFDYFYRGWKMPKEFKAAMDAQGGIGWPPAFRKPRKISEEGILYSFDEMMKLGFEPLSWNPYEQWRISRLQGVRYRQQQMLVDILKKTDIAKPTHTAGGTANIVTDYRMPRIGPAFEGKPVIIKNEAGGTIHTRAGGWQVHKDVARRLENIYGRAPRLPSVEVPGLRRAVGAAGKDITGEVDVQKVVDSITFVPKRAKLFMSLFQQIDFLTRSTIGTWTGMVDQLIPAIRKGDPKAAIRAVKHLAVWPKSMRDIVEANLSPNFRTNLKKQLLSTEELIPGRPGLHMKGLVENGLSVRDINIFPGGLDELAKLVAKDTGASLKRVGQMLGDLESATRRGLFEGVYPAAIMTDVKNNLVKIVVREFPDATDDQIMAMVAKMANVKYSTIPASQSLIQNQVLRTFLQRVFFSVGESEALLRQGTMAFHGPYKKLWQKHWLAAYMGLLATANTIHFASTGKPLPSDRYVPLSRDNYSFLPFDFIGYRTQFASPDLPSWAGLGGRNETRNTLDIVGQMDTVFRVLDPAGFLSARESVPVRFLENQRKGTDYFGAPINEVGPGGIISRGAAGVLDLFAPIGVGQTGVDILREQVPAVGELLPPGEERIGTGGQLLQGLGVNVRGEPTRSLRDRIARESGFTVEDPNRAGEPVRSWEDLSPRQMQQLRETRPDLLEEEQRRTEVMARRQQEYAVTRVERSTYENDLVSKLDRTADKYLVASVESAGFRPKAAREKVNEARTIFYNEIYGTVWDEEKKRFTKGIYKDALEREEPDPGTVDHLLWQYHKLFESARDPVSGAISFSGEAGQKFDEEEAKFWSGLNPDEARLLLSNIRIQEEKYPESVQRMLDASRYAGSLELNLGGHSGTYYDLESHPVIVQNIRAETGATQAEIDAYLALPYNERDDAAKEEPTKSIKKAYEDASRKNNVLWNAKKLFIDSSPAEWKWAMLEAGYGYQGKGKLEELMFNYLRTGGTRPNIQYEELYKRALVPTR